MSSCRGQRAGTPHTPLTSTQASRSVTEQDAGLGGQEGPACWEACSRGGVVPGAPRSADAGLALRDHGGRPPGICWVQAGRAVGPP